jgi:hypothetical protein
MKFFGTLVCVVALLFSISFAKDEMPVVELVKKHLDSIGTEQARAAVKSRVAQGVVRFHLQKQGGSQDGKEVFVSESNKLVSLLKLPNPSYHGERFVSDGKRTMVANIKPGVYSELGQFVNVHSEILTDGLWGGTLSAGWPLLDSLEAKHAKLQSAGRRKVDGRQLLQFRYLPARRSDLDIMLYFEPETGRHVMSAYSLTIAPQMAMTELETAKQKSTSYLLEERFADFKEQDGLTLPTKWKISFTLDVPKDPNHPGDAAIYARSDTWLFDVSVGSINHNVSLDPKNFEVK